MTVEQRQIELPGWSMLVKVTAEDSLGRLTVLDSRMAPQHAGPLPHVHEHHDETFVVLEGQLRFRIGEQFRTAVPGETVFAGRRLAHGFSNPYDQPARYVLMLRPSGYEDYFATVAEHVARTGALPDIDQIRELMARHHTVLVPPLPDDASIRTSEMIEELDPYITPQLEHSALLVIDTQVDFVDGSSFPIPGTTQVLPAITRLLHAYRAARLPIVHVIRLYHGDDVDLPRRTLIARGAPIARPGSVGSQIVPELRPEGAAPLDPGILLRGECQELAKREWAMWKPRWNAFHRTPLDEHLRRFEVTTVVIAGCNYPNCPRATVYGASERDYRVLVVSDAISGVALHHLDEASQMGVVSAPSSDITAHLAARCRAGLGPGAARRPQRPT